MIYGKSLGTVKNASKSKIELIHAVLHKEILEKKWGEGERLPTDLVLAERFDCSTGTVNKAMALLAHQRLIMRKHRMGTFVLPVGAENGSSSIQLNALAFIYPSDAHQGISAMLRGFQGAAGEARRRTVMLPTGTDFRKEVEFFSRLQEFEVRGAVTCPLIASPTEQLKVCEVLKSSKLPIVLVGVNLPGYCTAGVQVDNFHAGLTATRHLLGQGMKKVGFFAPIAWSQAMRDRHRGYQQAMEDAGIAGDSNWGKLTSRQDMHADFSEPLNEPTARARQFLEHCEVEAVVCGDDMVMAGMVKAALEKGIGIPGALRLVGIDGFKLGEISGMGGVDLSRMALASYHVPYEEMGRMAFQILDKVVSGQPDVPEETLLRGEIIASSKAS